MCSFHCRQIILKNCGGGKGEIPHSALWVYNMLSSCHDIETLENKQNTTNRCIPQTRTTCRGCRILFNIPQRDVQWMTTSACMESVSDKKLENKWRWN
jgi:hypothetical protein